MSTFNADGVTISFSQERNEEQESTATVHLHFREELGPKQGASLKTTIEYLLPSGRPIAHNGRVSSIRWGTVEVFDPETEGWKSESEGTHVSVHFVQQHFEGKIGFRFSWTDANDAEQELTHRVPAGDPVNEQVTTELPSYAPQLSAYLASAGTAHRLQELSGEGRPAEEHALGVILREVYTKLRWGFGNFWASHGARATFGAKALSEASADAFDGLTLGQLDEMWAQLITEAIEGTCYQGAQLMNADPPRDGEKDERPIWKIPEIQGVSDLHRFDASFLSHANERLQEDPTDTYIPVIMACQQLTSWSVFYRGHTEIHENPFDAQLWGNTGRVEGAKRITADQGASGSLSGRQMHAKGWLKPGAAVFLGPNKRHVGVVLRVDPVSQKFQLADTGGWLGGSFGTGQNFDSTQLSALPKPAGGMVVPPSDNQKLIDGIVALKKARPLAAGQLLIARRGAGSLRERLVWSSQALPLHEGSGDARHCYYISKLKNSLRGHPFSKLFELRWWVAAPKGPTVPRAKDQPDDWMHGDDVRFAPVLELGSASDGSVKILQKTKQGVETVKFDGPFGEFGTDSSGRLAPVGSIPGYFR